MHLLKRFSFFLYFLERERACPWKWGQGQRERERERLHAEHPSRDRSHDPGSWPETKSVRCLTWATQAPLECIFKCWGERTWCVVVYYLSLGSVMWLAVANRMKWKWQNASFWCRPQLWISSVVVSSSPWERICLGHPTGPRRMRERHEEQCHPKQ